ncbi:MAG: DUF2332 family protein, partial [Pseudomonadota bacterium]
LDPRYEPDATILGWPGDPSSDGESVPLRVCGALHWLALTGENASLAEVYKHLAATPAVWDQVFTEWRLEADHILKFIKSPPQTNEVARSSMVICGFGRIATLSGRPLSIFEFGASAGLNLNAVRYAYRFGERALGDDDSDVRLQPEWRGRRYTDPMPEIMSSRGCDLRPLDLRQPEAAIRLLSYIWPDQPQRTKRTKAALQVASNHPPSVEKAEGLSWVAEHLSDPSPGYVRVLYSTIAWQYLSPEKRKEGAAIIARIGHRATLENPLAWLRVEADGVGPGAAMTLDWWPGTDNHEQRLLGRADFHGRWIDWRPDQ